MRLGRVLIAMSVVGAAANGCGGGAFESADADNDSAGQASSSSGSEGTGGSKSNGSGGKSTTQPGGAGDDSGPDEGGADSGSGGSAIPLGGKSSGGEPPLGGNAGSPMAGGGANAGTGGSGMAGSSTGVDGPLKIADLEAIDPAKLTGFHVTGFRCKSLSICGANQTCVYYTGFLGSVQAQDNVYSDGDELDDPLAVKVRIAGGAQSDPNQCASSIFTLQPGQFVKLTHDGGHTVQVYFPEFSGPEVVFYVHANGNTYWDAALTQLAGKP